MSQTPKDDKGEVIIIGTGGSGGGDIPKGPFYGHVIRKELTPAGDIQDVWEVVACSGVNAELIGQTFPAIALPPGYENSIKMGNCGDGNADLIEFMVVKGRRYFQIIDVAVDLKRADKGNR